VANWSCVVRPPGCIRPLRHDLIGGAMATQVQDQIGVSGRPTHVRYLVIVFAVALAIITYIDRVCISQAAPAITRDLSLTTVQMGCAFAAFGRAYARFDIRRGG